jgi:hypothetical protein
MFGGGYLAVKVIVAWQEPSGRPLFLGLMGLLLGVFVAGFLLFFARARIEVDGERILKVSALGGKRSFLLMAVAGVAFRVVRQPLSPAPDPAVGVVYGRDGRRLFTFSAKFWDPDDLRRFADLLGTPDRGVPPIVSWRELDREFPGGFNVWGRDPYLFGFALALIVLGFAAVVLISLTG